MSFWIAVPTLKKVQQAGLGTVRRFFRSQGARREKLETKLAALPGARPLTPDPAVVTVGRLLTQTLVRQINR